MSLEIDKGEFVVKCMVDGGDTLDLYGVTVGQGDEIDLLADATSENIRAADFSTAEQMCRDTSFELGSKIAVGDWVIARTRRPSVLRQ